MRFLLMVVGLLLNASLLAQHDFLTFKAKADSLATVVDDHIALLSKQTMVGKLQNDAFTADAFIERSTNNIYKITCRLDTDRVADRERVFYYYGDHLTRMIVGGKVYYPFNEKVLDSAGQIVDNRLMLAVLDFEKNCLKLAKRLLVY